MSRSFAITALAAVLAVGSLPLSAHHSFAAEYDGNAPIKITGTLMKVDWVNPHSWIQIDVKDKDGKVTTWRCETAPPNGLIRRGWTKSSFPIGQEVTVEGYRAKDGSNHMSASNATINGKTMFTGSSGDGAPAREGDGK
jgi:hypothetical protein